MSSPMPDDVKAASIQAAFGQLIYDVCGPTARYLGSEFETYAVDGISNLKRIFGNARHQLRLVGESEGQVPPRVLQGVLRSGYFCEDELEASYLGGVLASARGPTSRDDRGIAYLAILDGLSTYQIRTHFILYSSILRADVITVGGTKISRYERDILSYVNRNGLTIGIAESDYRLAMDFVAGEIPEVIAGHSFVGLEERGLSRNGTRLVEAFPGQVCEPNKQVAFRYFYPTKLGIELFLWGQGRGAGGLDGYSSDILEAITIPIRVRPIFVEVGEIGY